MVATVTAASTHIQQELVALIVILSTAQTKFVHLIPKKSQKTRERGEVKRLRHADS